MQLRWSGHLVRMDDERLPKRLFYGDVATGSRRQGGPIRRYKDTLKSSLKLLQINPTNWEELACARPTWRRTVKTGAAIHEANRIAAAKAKREARKSQLRPVSNAAAQPLPTCPRSMRIRTTPALTAIAPSPHVSAWSVTCESIVQRPENQCLEHQPTPTKLVSTAHTVLALSGIAWVYSATYAFTTTCGRQPPVTPHPHTPYPPPPPPSPHQKSTLTHLMHPTATSHASGKSASRLGPHAASAARVI
nr:unnamed protein product [Spirometra erinaceieuropaei]